MNAADAIRTLITDVLGSSWRVQFGRWVDGTKTDRYVVIQPNGGLPAALVRTPQFTVSVIGALNDDIAASGDAADALIESMRTNSAGLVQLQASESTHIPTNDGRPIFQFAVEAITN